MSDAPAGGAGRPTSPGRVSSPVGYALLRRKQFRQRARAEGGDGASLNDALLERKFLQQQQMQERRGRGGGALDRDQVVSSPIGAMLLRRKMHRQRRSLEMQEKRDMGDLTSEDSDGRATPQSRRDDTDATTDDDSGPAGISVMRRTPPNLQRVVTTAPGAADALRSFPAQVSSPFGTALLHRKRQARQRGIPMSLSDDAGDDGGDGEADGASSDASANARKRSSPTIDTSSGRGGEGRFFNPSVSSPFGAALRLRKRGQQAASKLTRGDVSGSPRKLDLGDDES